MGNSAGVTKSPVQESPHASQSHQSVVGVINLVSKEADRLDQAANSNDAIQDYIRTTEDNATEGTEGNDCVQNVVDSVGNTVTRVSVSLDKIHEQLMRLHMSLTRFGEETYRHCEESSSGNVRVTKPEVVNKIKSHIDATNQLVEGIAARLESTGLDTKERKERGDTTEEIAKINSDRNTPKTHKSKETSVTDSERDRYETEIQQMKVIIDNLEDELESLKEESTEAINSMDAANERMQKIEEQVLDERLSHEVEVNALRAIIERQDEIMKSFNGGAVNDIWLNNQKKRLFSKMFSKDVDEDNDSEETCFDLIYVDQKSLKDDIRKHPSKEENKQNEDEQSESGQETETPSGVLLSFPYKKEEREQLDSRISCASKGMSNTNEQEYTLNSEGATMVSTAHAKTPDMSDAIPDNSKAMNEDTHESREAVVADSFPTRRNDSAKHPETRITSVGEQEQPTTSQKCDVSEKTVPLNSSTNPEIQRNDAAKDVPAVLECSAKVPSMNLNSNSTGNIGNNQFKVDNADKDVINISNSESEMKDAVVALELQDQYVDATDPDNNDHTIASVNDDALDDSYTHAKEAEEEIVLFDEGVTKEIIYKRSDGEVDGCLSYYRGVGVIIRTTVPALGAETLTCDVTDAVMADMLPDLVEGERAISFHIHIQKKYGTNVTRKDTEFVQIFVPHRAIPEHEEAALVCSVNGEDWEQFDVIDETPASLSNDVKVLCTEINDVSDVKLVAIARAKTVHLIGGEDDVTYQSRVDPSVSVKMNTECFSARCGVNLMVHHIHQEALTSAAEIHVECRHVTSCTAFVSLVCERTTTEDVYVLMTLEPGPDYECKYTMFLLEDTAWKLADCDWNKTTNVLTIHLMAGAKKYRVIGLELSHDLSVEERLLATRTLHQHTSHYTVRALFRQKESDPTQAVVICLRVNLVEQGIAQLCEAGYSIGGPPSEQFCLTDGDSLTIQCSGDIAAKPFQSRRMDMSFYSQKEIATKQLSLYPASSEVKPGTKMHQGRIHVLKDKPTGYAVLAETIHMPVENASSSQ